MSYIVDFCWLKQDDTNNNIFTNSRVPVMTNFVYLELDKDKLVHEYIACFSPNLDDTKTRKRVIYTVGAILGSTRTFDGTKLWLPYELTQEVRKYFYIFYSL